MGIPAKAQSRKETKLRPVVANRHLGNPYLETNS